MLQQLVGCFLLISFFITVSIQEFLAPFPCFTSSCLYFLLTKHWLWFCGEPCCVLRKYELHGFKQRHQCQTLSHVSLSMTSAAVSKSSARTREPSGAFPATANEIPLVKSSLGGNLCGGGEKWSCFTGGKEGSRRSSSSDQEPQTVYCMCLVEPRSPVSASSRSPLCSLVLLFGVLA